jgi:hypothetical protein
MNNDYCAAVSLSGKEQSPYCSTCVAVADFLHTHRGVACRMSTEKETPLWLPYIASLHYVNTPKHALVRSRC